MCNALVCRRRIVVTLLVVHLALPAIAHAVNLTITPLSLAADSSGTITLDITGVASGQKVLVETFLDTNRNGTIDSGEPLVQSFKVADGQAEFFDGVRNSNKPGDEDGTVDGKIRTVLSFKALAESNQAIAKFVYKVSPAPGSAAFTPVTQAFEITQPAYAQKVQGQVTSGGSPVPFAFVFLIEGSGHGGPVVAALADITGHFTMNSAPGTYALAAFKSGFVLDLSVAPSVTITSGVTTTQGVSLAPANATISGQLVEAGTTKGIPGVQTIAQDNSSHDGGLMTLVVTGADGTFSIPVSTASPQWGLDASNRAAALSGYLSFSDRLPVDISGGNVSGVSVQWPKVTALIYGDLKDDQGHPLAGVSLYAFNNPYEGLGLSDSSGRYVIGVTAGTWSVGPSNDDPALQGYIVQGTQVTVGDGHAVQADVTVQHCTAHLSGQVTDNGGAPMSGIQVMACNQQSQGGSCPSANSGADGSFDVCVSGGTWNLSLESQGMAERGLVGPNVQETVSDNGSVTNINMHARAATAHITGFVRDSSSTAISGIGVYASATASGTNYDAYVTTDISGQYSLTVFDTTWQVGVDCGGLSDRGYGCLGIQSVPVAGADVVLNFTAQPPTPLQITTNSLPNGSAGTPYNVSLGAEGGVPPYNWSLAPGSEPLPPGLSLSPDGFISGTPTGSGTSSFVARVTDGASHIADQGLSITINVVPLQITTAEVPNGYVDSPYSQQLQASGGVLPYNWSLALGSQSLPPGLQLSADGTLFGTPTVEGAFNFIVHVADGVAQAADRGLSLAVLPPLPTPTITATPTVTPTPTTTPTPRPCVGDCGGNHVVTVDELVTGVDILLGAAPLADCPVLDTDGSDDVTVDELVKAVEALLRGCRD